ncbi:ATP-binding cassette domain-containing protein [Solirubrobacter phytolaccae]|uniref:ATP-binding cassette domain-containing protein n=1 Tax=Solirubrobacter phytolaccae TaxID=1404360 RepID=A0A9X3SA83_9ACTN|nr:ATP-binding cassette domain-containing protein [Solirubrobacter phytolaccae]MDA0183378.1 ATP-binding cassette domain-containing protein [Solirubrobacter phytolaccae]
MTDLAHELYLFAAVLGLLAAVGLAGVPVLAQSAFVAVGGFGALRLEQAGLPIGGALLAATALGAVAGALTGLLIARAEPAFAALSTWALAWLAPLCFPTDGLVRPAFDTVQTPFGTTLELTPGVHLVAAVVLCGLAALVVHRLRANAIGSDAVALREDPELARELRVPIAARKALLLALAGATGAAAGAGIAILLGVAAPTDASPLLALELLAAALAATRHPLLGLVAIVALHRAPDLITPLILLAAVLARRPLGLRPDDVVPAETPPLEPARGGLEVRDLHVTRGGREILRGFDLTVAAGEIHALLGPNGSGKSTTIDALPVARTFQRDAGFPSLTPYRQVLLALRAPGHDERVWTYLRLVGVPAEATDLGTGERRLLAVARAAATGAPNLAFDEPAVGMSAEERHRLAGALRQLAASGRAVLIVEHDLRWMTVLADQITVLEDGRAAGVDALARVYA